jgi:hypothetical protein
MQSILIRNYSSLVATPEPGVLSEAGKQLAHRRFRQRPAMPSPSTSRSETREQGCSGLVSNAMLLGTSCSITPVTGNSGGQESSPALSPRCTAWRRTLGTIAPPKSVAGEEFRIKPDAPSARLDHPDHGVIGQPGVAAFRQCQIRTYGKWLADCSGKKCKWSTSDRRSGSPVAIRTARGGGSRFLRLSPRLARQQPAHQRGPRQHDNQVCAVAVADHIRGAIDRFVRRAVRGRGQVSDQFIDPRIAAGRVFHDLRASCAAPRPGSRAPNAPGGPRSRTAHRLDIVHRRAESEECPRTSPP